MFLHVTHANGQTSEIPVSVAHTLNVRDDTGSVVASVSFAGVTDFNIAYTSLYEAVEEPAVEPEPVAAEPEPAAEPDAPSEPDPVEKPRRAKK